jgi:hypothetical protein
MFKKLTNIMKKARNLCRSWLRQEFKNSILFMSVKRFSSKGNTTTSRAVLSMLDVHSGRQEELQVAREVGHVRSKWWRRGWRRWWWSR